MKVEQLVDGFLERLVRHLLRAEGMPRTRAKAMAAQVRRDVEAKRDVEDPGWRTRA